MPSNRTIYYPLALSTAPTFLSIVGRGFYDNMLQPVQVEADKFTVTDRWPVDYECNYFIVGR